MDQAWTMGVNVVDGHHCRARYEVWDQRIDRFFLAHATSLKLFMEGENKSDTFSASAVLHLIDPTNELYTSMISITLFIQQNNCNSNLTG